MDRPKKQVTILTLLAIVMVVVYGKAFLPSRSSTADVESSEAADHIPSSDASSSASYDEHHNVLFEEEFASIREEQSRRMMNSAWVRDPFASGSGNGSLSGLSLSGIMWDPSTPVAIINGELVNVGDTIDRYRIVSITKDEVSVTDGVETFQLNTAP